MRFTIATAAVILAACSPAPGEPIANTGEKDRIFDVDCPKPGPTGTDPTFKAIYAELLGPKSVARCQDASCHGGASEQGGLRLGNDITDAHKGMKDYGLIVPGTPDGGAPDGGAPDGGASETPAEVAGLVRVIVPLASTGKPKMPREICGNRALNAAEIERIKAWGRKGANND